MARPLKKALRVLSRSAAISNGTTMASGGRVKGLLQGPVQEMLRFFDHLSAANTGAGSSVHVPAAWALDAMC